MEEEKAVKISLNRDTKEVIMTKTFEELKNNLKDLFKDSLPAEYKLCYVDDDGDILTIRNNLDYETAVSFIRKNAKIIILPLDSVPENSMDDFEIVNHPKSNYEIINDPESSPESKMEVKIFEIEDRPEEKKPTEEISLFEAPKESDKEEKEPTTESKEELKNVNSEYVPVSGGLFSCLYCKGSGINKKRKQCKKCDGTGKMSEHMLNRVREIVKLELNSLIQSEASQYASQIAMSQSMIASNIVHKNARCDSCKVNPIKGIRYKCNVCPSYNLCEACEINQGHDHPMLKLRNALPKEEGKYKVEICEETYGPGKNYLLPGAKLFKRWKFKNTGTCSWPKETVLVSMDASSPEPKTMNGYQVHPGNFLEANMSFDVPSSPATYIWRYQLLDDKKKRIGSVIPFELIVKESEEEEVRKAIVKQFPSLNKRRMENLIILAMMKTGHSPEDLLKVLSETQDNIEEAANLLIDRNNSS